MKNDDSKQPVTKKQFELTSKHFDKRFEQVDKRFEQVDKRFEQVDKQFIYLKKYIDQRITDLEEKMYTKEDHAKFMTYMDEAMKELRDARNERSMNVGQMLRMDDQIANHEKRIRVLEKSNS